MSNVLTVDVLREETIKRYSPVSVELSDGSTIELKSILRLKQKAREEVLAAVDEINSLEKFEDDEDEELVAEYANSVCEIISKIFRLITSSPRKLIAELDHEDPMIKANLHIAVLYRWIGESQLGEAASSLS